jgi:ATP-dependent Lhr-like helicase
MTTNAFHPAVTAWFDKSFDQPTQVQKESWASIANNQHTLLAAPTGSGKTLAAFMVSIDRLIKEGLQQPLEQQTRVLYISPLKALSNDIQLNLQLPIQGIRDSLLENGLPDVPLQAWVRTGDTPAAERSRAIRKPPHILVTTPESVYILLTSDSGRQLLSTVETVIVDEIHAVAGSKRGSHLCLSLERLEALTNKTNPGKKLQRIGLSATQKPIELMAKFLIGNRKQQCHIVDTGHAKQRDLGLELPRSPLEAVMANEVWIEVYNRLHHLIDQHQTTLIFVNTRRLAERVSKNIAERIGEGAVMAHHGSMSKDKRHSAEQALKAGKLRCLVATASLELGIDIGDINLVCQLGSPRSIAAFLQRVGRSGHQVGGIPKGRLFPLTRDELVETTALLGAASNGELDRIIIQEQPLDVLSQQIVAEVSGQEWACDDLFQMFNQAWPYRHLARNDFDDIIQMLGDGYSTRRGRRGAYLHFDAVNGRVRARRNARLVALTNGGAIPDQFDSDVILSPEDIRIGSVGEDFAFESLPGGIFQLGNASYRVLKVETGRMYVEDAHGQPPNLPFWFGEAPGRTDELSFAVSTLRKQTDEKLKEGMDATQKWFQNSYRVSNSAAEQLTAYLASAKAALGSLPTQDTIIFERFFDDVGDMHFVIHSNYGSRINRAWGLALRKRFCKRFNFELQAAALEDSIVLSLSSSHSFPLEEVSRYLNPKTVRDVLIQAFLDVPMFPTRWRWNATIALAVLRSRNGKRNPPYFQRSDAEDLVAILFPDQIACGENIAGDRQVPDHPLIKQTINDCLHDTMDIVGLEALLTQLLAGNIKLLCCDLTAPSPLAEEVVNARPYAFLDEAPAEERRTLAVTSRSRLNPADAAELATLDQTAIDKVREEAWPTVRNADELQDAMQVLGYLLESEVDSNQLGEIDESNQPWIPLFKKLIKDKRACRVVLENESILWVAAERLAQVIAVFPQAQITPNIPPVLNQDLEDPLRELVRSRLEGLGPVTVGYLADPLGLPHNIIQVALINLEQEGFVVQGRFTKSLISSDQAVEWCERRLLARIHRYTISRLRSEIEPVSLADYMRFLFEWQGLNEKREGLESLAIVLQQLEGYSAAAGSWENDILPARIDLYTQDMLETLCVTGRFSWLRLHTTASQSESKQKNSPIKLTPISIVQRHHLLDWKVFCKTASQQHLSSSGKKVIHLLNSKGALFFTDIVNQTGLLRTQVEAVLGELVSWGMINSDGFSGLRALITPSNKLPRFSGRMTKRAGGSPFDRAGRWALISEFDEDGETINAADTIPEYDALELIAHTLLMRYGVVFRRVLDRETGLPPWRDLLRVYWRMEARGEIRGGRFVSGVSGEQFAFQDAIGSLRKIRRAEKNGDLVTISACDPLNLTGTLLPGEKVPISNSRQIVFRDGIPIATQFKDKLEFLCDLDEQTQWNARLQLTNHRPRRTSRAH